MTMTQPSDHSSESNEHDLQHEENDADLVPYEVERLKTYVDYYLNRYVGPPR